MVFINILFYSYIDFSLIYYIIVIMILIDTLFLAWVGGNAVKYPFYELGQICTVIYFGYFFFILPLCCKIEKILWYNKSV